MRYCGKHPIAVFLAGLVLTASFAGGCAPKEIAVKWTPRPCSLEGPNRDLLLNGPVVPVIFFTETWELPDPPYPKGAFTTKVKASAKGLGSATVLSKDRLLVSAHEVDADTGTILIEGHYTGYKVVRRVDGSEEAGGWALVKLRKPIPQSFSSIDVDFKANLAVGDAIFIVYCQPPSTTDVVEKVENGTLKEQPREKILVEGRVVPPPFEDTDERLDEFLIVDTRCPSGSSGSPVFWWRDDDTPVLVGIVGGTYKRFRPHWLTGQPTDELIASVQLIRQPHEYEPMETTEAEE